VTHVLALGISAILISGLLIGVTGLLTDQRQNAANQQLGTIGNRLASQVMEADEVVDDDTDGVKERVTIRVEQPANVAGSGYSVDFQESECVADFKAFQPSNNDSTNACLTLEHGDATGERYQIPVEVDQEVIDGDVDITFRQVGSGEFLITAEET
jgi:type II secretory pathway pseudopilin PulG